MAVEYVGFDEGTKPDVQLVLPGAELTRADKSIRLLEREARRARRGRRKGTKVKGWRRFK